ncbi:MAG: ATP-binding cassette domain-containing protein [Acidimicrobiia bacterium]
MEQSIEVSALTKTFGRGVRALEGVTLSVGRGVIYGLLGPNGAGKTTLIRVLATLLRPDGGTARVGGFDVRTQPDAVRTVIGLAGQYAAVDEFLTGRENVEMVGRLYGLGRREANSRSGAVLEQIGLAETADRPVRTYSGGMRRRLDLAASLVGRPEVLFLDEPTSGVDPASRAGLWSLIKSLVEAGTTVLMTTQYLDESDRLADQIAVLDRGRLIGEGTAAELKDRVGGSVLEIGVPAEERSRALRALREEWNGQPSFDAVRGRICLPAQDDTKTLADAMRRLAAAAVKVEDVALHKPTLDDVFLALTGHATATGPNDADNGGRSAVANGSSR